MSSAILVTTQGKQAFSLMASGIFFISTAARELGMHPQTLRKYERLGFVQPSRTIGSMRMYSADEIRRLRAIKRLVDELGINLAGVQQLLSVAEIVDRIRPLLEDDDNTASRGLRHRRALKRELDRLSRAIGF